MKTINYPELVRNLFDHNKSFFDKYSIFVKKNINERQLERGILLARLKLVAQAMQDAKTISNFTRVDILGHKDSIALTPHNSPMDFYLLNGGIEVIASYGGVTGKKDLLTLISYENNPSQGTFYSRYQSVLSEEFDWSVFAHEILEAIHKSVYNKSAVQMDQLKQQLFND